VLVPIVYFGAQLLAAPFYPGYSFLRQAASELGSDRSDRPGILNAGAMLTGIAAIVAACAMPVALPREKSPRFLAWLTAVAMISMGIGAIWAGVNPLPSPRHNSGPIGAGMFFVPLLFAIALWRRGGALRVYLLVNVALFVLLVPLMSGASGIDVNPFRGFLQRIAAAVLYVPIGVVSAALLRRR
jgi:hypothetical membrane protein